MRIAFHAINGVGLGHLVRATTLALEVRRLAPASDLLVVTNAGDTSLLDRAGLDFVKLPPRVGEPHADPERCLSALPEALEETALLAAFEAFAPDLVVFDTHVPSAIARGVSRIGARSVLVLRELRPETLAAFARSPVATLFDRIVVPHEAGEVDLSPLDGLPVFVVGPVVRALPRSTTPKAPRVLAMAGGGGQPVDAARYVRAVADAHLLARVRVPKLETVLVTGPYGAAPPHVERYPGLTVLRAPEDLDARLASATLVVSQAGYNAVAELRALRKPAVLVPGYRKSEDQRARARRLARAGAAVIARPEARAIADRIEGLLLAPGKLAAMRDAHARVPLVPRNTEAARTLLATVTRPRSASPVLRKVVLIAHDFAPKIGGMESVARSLAADLLARGVDVRVYTTSRLGADVASGLGDGVVRPIYTPLPPPRRIDLEDDLLVTIDALLRDAPDVVHLCHAGLGPWVPALRAAVPAVITAHVHGNDLLLPWVHSGQDDATYRAHQIAGLSGTDAVIAVSRYSRDLALGAGVSERVLQVVENGVDPDRFAETAPRSDRWGLAADDEIVLTVSRLAPRKGHRTVVRALALLAAERPRLKFVFTGASASLVAELEALAEELGVRSRLVATGFVSEDELSGLYHRAHLFALLAESDPADVEGFGVALLEAAAAGLPTVATSSGGVPEAVHDGVTGLLVPPDDPAAAASAMRRLLDDPALARALGAKGRERVRASFSIAAQVARIEAIWTTALAAGTSMTAASGHRGVVLLARERAARARADRTTLRETLRAKIARGQTIRVRATGDGARRLPTFLNDCADLGHAPSVEVKLRRFLESDFQAYALPRIASVELVHGVPTRGASTPAALLASLRALPDTSLARIGALRLFLDHDAKVDLRLASSAVPEVHALRRFFAALPARPDGTRAVVVPPPELMRWLSEVPAGGPETAMIEPTNLCNLACPTCPTGTGKIKPLPQMTLARFGEVLGGLMPKLRNLALWNYGEPLLNRELPRMIAEAKSAGVGVVKVSSNVHFLDGDRGRALLASGLDVLILSVDGASQATYATFRKDGDFETVARSVAWLAAEKKRLGLAKPRIELQFIVMRHNEHELPEMRRLAKTWGVDALRIKTVGAEDTGTKDLVPASRLLSRYAADGKTPNVRHAFCTMAWDHTVVNVDGSVTPCCYLRPDMGEEFVMGNVFASSFVEIWRGERYRAFRAAMLAGRESMPVCNRCRGGTHDLLAAVEVPS